MEILPKTGSGFAPDLHMGSGQLGNGYSVCAHRLSAGWWFLLTLEISIRIGYISSVAQTNLPNFGAPQSNFRFCLGGTVGDGMLHSRPGGVVSACFHTQTKQNHAGKFVFSCVFNSRTKFSPKTFGFHVFLKVCRMVLKRRQIDFPHSTTVWQNNMWTCPDMGTLLEIMESGHGRSVQCLKFAPSGPLELLG